MSFQKKGVHCAHGGLSMALLEGKGQVAVITGRESHHIVHASTLTGVLVIRFVLTIFLKFS